MLTSKDARGVYRAEGGGKERGYLRSGHVWEGHRLLN